jgi:enoyl-CoA hydratase
MSVVLFEVEEGVATITINRPEARNSLSPEVLFRLRDAWRRVGDDDAIRVAIITGAGQEAFCAGADLKRFIPLFTGARPPEDKFDCAVLAEPLLPGQATLRDYDPGKPVIAAINGFALAGGMEMLNGTDIRIASITAQLGVREVQRGLVAHGSTPTRLPRQIPYVHAMEMLLTGEMYSAEHMLRVGYVNYVVPPEELMPKARAIAARIAANGPLAVQLTREMVKVTQGIADEAEALAREAEMGQAIYKTYDAIEGPRAFAEKRPPKFEGR